MKFACTVRAAVILASTFFHVSKEEFDRLVPFRPIEDYLAADSLEAALKLLEQDVRRFASQTERHFKIGIGYCQLDPEHGSRLWVHLHNGSAGGKGLRQTMSVLLIDQDDGELRLPELCVMDSAETESTTNWTYLLRFKRDEKTDRVHFELNPTYTGLRMSDHVSEGLNGLLEANLLEGQSIASTNFLLSALHTL